jgi:nitrogen-specific signal transduction histidine kinase/ActR/RegA family two-component response regulator
MAMIAGLVFDSTERHQLEDQLLQATKMESLGRLAGGVAHDFNNLLTVIMSYADLLKESTGDEATMQGGLAEIEAASHRAASLTRQLLTFARRQIFSPRAVNLNVLTAGMERMLRHLIGEDIQIELDLCATSPLSRVDPHQIEQVIINLAVNARAAMPDGGTLRIATANLSVEPVPGAQPPTAVPPGDYVTIVVRDTGVGIPPELLTKIFEPFFTTRPKGEGTGLGLSTSYGIVAQFHGHIRVMSEVGAGTTVVCYLPVADAADVEPVIAPKANTIGGHETVLVVEDEPMVRDVAKRTLERRGYRVLTATNGIEGLRIAAETEGGIDLLLTDVVMPQMGGRELAERLRACRPAVKVLFTSGYNEEFATGEGQLVEGVEFLQKPYLPASLLEHVRRVLDAVTGQMGE